jgi:hypothetical protein
MFVFFLSVAQSAKADPPLYPHLAAEINQMTVEDQAIRMKWIDALSGKKPDVETLGKQMSEIDHRDTERMKWVVKEFGWPTPVMVGKEASENAWLLVQHADADRDFQKSCLTLIEPLARNHIIRGSDYAYLFDRVQTGAGKLQRFGTQGMDRDGLIWIDPVEDPARVDVYRKQFDLQPLEEYAKSLAEVYKEKLAPDWRKRLIPPKNPPSPKKP